MNPEGKTYRVREIFDTLQGEGTYTGARAVFVRFAGCNLWDGVPEHRDRGRGACAGWCDTEFRGGKALTAAEIVAEVSALWPDAALAPRRAVLTGGEPMLQVDAPLLRALSYAGILAHVETNGTVDFDRAVTSPFFVTVSPKLGGGPTPAVRHADEVKVVLPGGRTSLDPGWSDAQLHELADRAPPRAALFVQPQDGRTGSVEECIAFVRRNPRWRLSVQTHKLLELP